MRIGSIYALERVARDSARHHLTVMEVLTAFIREYSHKPLRPPGPGGGKQERSARPDVQAALTVVGRRKRKRDITPVDLTRAPARPVAGAQQREEDAAVAAAVAGPVAAGGRAARLKGARLTGLTADRGDEDTVSLRTHINHVF